jgi:hypothetical protein
VAGTVDVFVSHFLRIVMFSALGRAVLQQNTMQREAGNDNHRLMWLECCRSSLLGKDCNDINTWIEVLLQFIFNEKQGVISPPLVLDLWESKGVGRGGGGHHCTGFPFVWHPRYEIY